MFLWRAGDSEGEVLDIGMQRFKSPGSAQRFLSTHAAVYNSFYTQRHLISRKTLRQFRTAAMEEWRAVVAA